MPTDRLVLAFACLLIVVAGVWTPCPAQGPEINIPAEALSTSSMPDTYVAQIQQYVKYWIEQFPKADDKTALAAGKALRSAYTKYDNNSYRHEYAQTVSQQAPAVIAKLQGAPAVNLALALSRIHEAPMLPVLEDMVHHPFAGVRYLGWKGYASRGMREMVMAQGMAPTKRLFDTLADRAAKDDSPAVLGLILEMLRVPAAAGALSEDVVKFSQKRSWAILQQIWPRLCQRVTAGDEEIARTGRQGVSILEYYSLLDLSVPKQKTIILQMIMDIMYYSATAFDTAGAEGPVADADAQLLRECERVLNGITGTPHSYLQRALATSKAADRGGAALRAVFVDKSANWVDDLKSAGVAKPKDLAPADSTTGPATK